MNKEQGLADFFTYLRFPSISSDLHHLKDVRECAEWVAAYLKKGGFKSEIWETGGHPTVFASYEIDPAKPTILFYGHYDVQPVDPLGEWVTPPFEPTIRDGAIYARGAQDNKGQCFYTMWAATSLLKEKGSLPVNVKFLIEGEEEIGSPSLPACLKEHEEEIKADYLAIVDVSFPALNKPAVTIGIRGIASMDLIVTGSRGDLHSGAHGGLAFNPIHAIVELLSSLRNPATGEIAVPGFYDDVILLTPKERETISLEFDEANYETLFGIPPTGGEKKLPPLERNVLRPSLEINGIKGGFAEPGFKTVIPAKASAKISLRLVPDQDPAKTAKLVADFLQKNAPPGIKVEVKVHPGSGLPFRANPNSPIVKAFQKTYSELYNTPCSIIMEGASIPISSELVRATGAEAVLAGVGLPTDNIHAPNEHFGLDRLEKGFLSITHLLQTLKGP